MSPVHSTVDANLNLKTSYVKLDDVRFDDKRKKLS